VVAVILLFPLLSKTNELISIPFPSGSLKLIVVKVFPVFALFVFKLLLVLVKVIFGAWLSVTLTINDFVPTLLKELVAVTVPDIWSPPSFEESARSLVREIYPEELIENIFDGVTLQFTDWLAVNLEVVPEYPFALSYTLSFASADSITYNVVSPLTIGTVSSLIGILINPVSVPLLYESVTVTR